MYLLNDTWYNFSTLPRTDSKTIKFQFYPYRKRSIKPNFTANIPTYAYCKILDGIYEFTEGLEYQREVHLAVSCRSVCMSHLIYSSTNLPPFIECCPKEIALTIAPPFMSISFVFTGSIIPFSDVNNVL